MAKSHLLQNGKGVFHIQLDPQLADLVRRAAREDDRTVTSWIRKLIHKELDWSVLSKEDDPRFRDKAPTKR